MSKKVLFFKSIPVSYRVIVFYERNIAATSNSHWILERNGSLLWIENIVSIYAFSEFQDRNILWVLSFSAECSLEPGETPID